MILPRKARFARRPALGRRFIRDNQAFASFHQSDSADNPRARNFSVHPKPGQRRDLQKIRAFIEQRLDPLPPFGLANSTMVVGNDGVIVIDTLESLTSARNVAAAFRAIGSKPVKAVVYTHNHTDHILGIKAFVKEEDVRSGAVTVFAHSTMMQTAIGNASIIGPILSVRSAVLIGSSSSRRTRGPRQQRPWTETGCRRALLHRADKNLRRFARCRRVRRQNASGLRAQRNR